MVKYEFDLSPSLPSDFVKLSFCVRLSSVDLTIFLSSRIGSGTSGILASSSVNLTYSLLSLEQVIYF